MHIGDFEIGHDIRVAVSTRDRAQNPNALIVRFQGDLPEKAAA